MFMFSRSGYYRGYDCRVTALFEKEAVFFFLVKGKVLVKVKESPTCGEMHPCEEPDFLQALF